MLPRLVVAVVAALVLTLLPASTQAAAPGAAAPAVALRGTPQAGERCITTSQGIMRCAHTQRNPFESREAVAVGYVIDMEGTRWRVRMRVIHLQRRVDGGWRTVATRRLPGQTFHASSRGNDKSVRCETMPAGRYRARAKADWRLPGRPAISSWITSFGVKKRRIC